MNNILLINDMAGYGKVALSAMIPIMSNMKFQVVHLKFHVQHEISGVQPADSPCVKHTGLR